MSASGSLADVVRKAGRTGRRGRWSALVLLASWMSAGVAGAAPLPFTGSLALMIDERYRGQMSMYDSVDSMTGLGGKIAGIADPFNATDAEIDQIVEVWKKIQANIKFYWTDSSQVEQAIAAGELVASWAWNEAVINLSNQGVPVKYMKPKEGLFTWVCGLALGKNGEGSEGEAPEGDES